MKVALAFPERFSGILQPVRDEFENLAARIKSGWSREHNADGSHQAITTQTCASVQGYTEFGRTVAMGVWKSHPYQSTDFTGNASMTWTVGSNDLENYDVMLIGQTLFVDIRITDSSVGGTPSTVLQIALPPGLASRRTHMFTTVVADNGTVVTSKADIVAETSTIRCFANPGGTAWTASTNNTDVLINTFFELKP